MTNQLSAIKVDPYTKTVTEITLPTQPGNPDEGYGIQIKAKDAAGIIGCRNVDFHHLDESAPDLVAIVDDEGLLHGCRDFWQYGASGQPLPGIGIIISHDLCNVAFSSPPLTLDAVRDRVIWSRRVVRGFKTTSGEGVFAST